MFFKYLNLWNDFNFLFVHPGVQQHRGYSSCMDLISIPRCSEGRIIWNPKPILWLSIYHLTFSINLFFINSSSNLFCQFYTCLRPVVSFKLSVFLWVLPHMFLYWWLVLFNSSWESILFVGLNFVKFRYVCFKMYLHVY